MRMARVVVCIGVLAILIALAVVFAAHVYAKGEELAYG